jgi:hypothetical protein
VLRLRQTLREFFPAALGAFDDLAAIDTLQLLTTAPDPTSAARLTTAQIAAALRRAHRRHIDVKAAMPALGRQRVEDVEVCDPPREYKTVAPSAERGHDIVDDLSVARFVGDQRPMHRSEVRDVIAVEVGLVDVQKPSWPGARLPVHREQPLIFLIHGVPDRSELPIDDLAEPVAARRRRRQAQPELAPTRLTEWSYEAAARWWHSSTMICP